MKGRRVVEYWIFPEKKRKPYQINGALKSIQAEEMHGIITRWQCKLMSTHQNIIVRNESFRGPKYLQPPFLRSALESLRNDVLLPLNPLLIQGSSPKLNLVWPEKEDMFLKTLYLSSYFFLCPEYSEDSFFPLQLDIGKFYHLFSRCVDYKFSFSLFILSTCSDYLVYASLGRKCWGYGMKDSSLDSKFCENRTCYSTITYSSAFNLSDTSKYSINTWLLKNWLMDWEVSGCKEFRVRWR